MAEISIILVNYNDRPHLEDCLRSIKTEGETIDLEVIVVDNASTDGSPALVQQRFPWVRLVRNPKNLGFSRANNKGFHVSSGDFVLFLNTDTTFFSGALTTLRDKMKKDPEIGAAGPILVNKEKKCQVSFGGKRGYFHEAVLKLFLNRIYQRRIGRLRTVKEVDWVSGACLFVRRKAFEEAGQFDERFFLYYEDIDLCFRIKNCGWKIVLLPQAHIFHEGGASTSSLSLKSRYHYRESQIYFYEKHNSRLSRMLLHWTLRLGFSALFLGGWIRKKEDLDLRKKFFSLL